MGNTHYANSTAQLSGTAVDQHASASFGSFVDDEYTVLLLRGGHLDGNTVFYDSNTAAGETITFPAHSHSTGKTRQAKTITVVGNAVTHENTNGLGLHGSSISIGGTADYLNIVMGEDGLINVGEDFCVEGWVRPSAVADEAVFAWESDAGAYAGGDSMYLMFYNSLWYWRWSGGGIALNNPPVVAGSWYHFACQRREGKLIEFFIDGVNFQSEVSPSDVAFDP